MSNSKDVTVAEEAVESRKSIPFLRSADLECPDLVDTELTGQVPDWLSGTLIRNGPGKRKVGKEEYKHVFDGLSLMHLFDIEDGKIRYRNRFLRSDSYNMAMKANRIVVSEFGTRAHPDPCLSLLQRYMSYFSLKKPMTDNGNVNIFPIGDGLYAATETTRLNRIDPKTLETLEAVNVSQFVAVNTQTAHPHIDADGMVYNLGNSYGKGNPPAYNVVTIPKTDKALQDAKILATIPAKNKFSPSYYHSFGYTENYIIFVEQALVMSMGHYLWRHFTAGSYAGALRWKPELGCRFHMVSKKTGQVERVYEAAAFSFFHTINAYEEDGHVVLDLCAYPDGAIVETLYEESLTKDLNDEQKKDSLSSRVIRFVMPLNVKDKASSEENLVTLKDTKAEAHLVNGVVRLKPEDLVSGNPRCELPQINYDKYNGKKYGYFYGISALGANLSNRLMKHDIVNNKTLFWTQPDCYPSEPVFVPRPGAVDEDDGVLLSAVLEEADERRGFLLVLDAKTMTELARGVYRSPGVITADFHGRFLQR